MEKQNKEREELLNHLKNIENKLKNNGKTEKEIKKIMRLLYKIVNKD